jgi:hypothetical protein
MMWKLHLEMQEIGRCASDTPKPWQVSGQMASERAVSYDFLGVQLHMYISGRCLSRTLASSERKLAEGGASCKTLGAPHATQLSHYPAIFAKLATKRLLVCRLVCQTMYSADPSCRYKVTMNLFFWLSVWKFSPSTSSCNNTPIYHRQWHHHRYHTYARLPIQNS